MLKHAQSKLKRVAIEGLAEMTARGFEDVEQRLGDRIHGLGQEMRTGFQEMRTEMRTGFQSVNARLDTIRQDIADLDDLRERVAAIEMRMGITRKK